MARPPSDDPRCFGVTVRLTADEQADLDRKRGPHSRSDWLRGLIQRAPKGSKR